MLDLFTVEVNGKYVTVFVGSDATKIVDSYLVSTKEDKTKVLSVIRNRAPEAFGKRKDPGLLREWKAHNILYKIGYERARTKDVDFENDQDLLHTIGYAILSLLPE